MEITTSLHKASRSHANKSIRSDSFSWPTSLKMNSHELEYVEWKSSINKGCFQMSDCMSVATWKCFCILCVCFVLYRIGFEHVKLCQLIFQLIENLILCTLTHFIRARLTRTPIWLYLCQRYIIVYLCAVCEQSMVYGIWVYLGRLDVVAG